MPIDKIGGMKNRNSATIAGHNSIWHDENRRKNSHNAGQGDRGSRNQGTGEAGQANTIASNGIDTSRMDKEQKLKYFNSLGLMPGEDPITIKNWPHKLQEIFADEKQYLKDISVALKSVPKDKYGEALQAGVQATKELKDSDDVYDIYAGILAAIEAFTI